MVRGYQLLTWKKEFKEKVQESESSNEPAVHAGDGKHFVPKVPPRFLIYSNKRLLIADFNIRWLSVERAPTTRLLPPLLKLR
jgi:hypothetical protein